MVSCMNKIIPQLSQLSSYQTALNSSKVQRVLSSLIFIFFTRRWALPPLQNLNFSKVTTSDARIFYICTERESTPIPFSYHSLHCQHWEKFLCTFEESSTGIYVLHIHIVFQKLLLLEGNSRISSHVSVSFATLSSVCQGVLDGLFKFS